MKGLIVAISVLASYAALACQPEAQIIVHVKDVVKTTQGCSFGLSLDYNRGDMWNMSYVCPLDYDVASSVSLTDASCSLKNGDVISGVLVQKEDGSFDLE